MLQKFAGPACTVFFQCVLLGSVSFLHKDYAGATPTGVKGFYAPKIR